MDLLNPRCSEAWNYDLVIATPFGQSPILASEKYGRESEVLSSPESTEYVGAIATGAEADKNIAGTSKRFNLARKDAIVAIIVADAGQGGNIRIDADGRESTALEVVTSDQFFGKMERVGSAASISAG